MFERLARRLFRRGGAEARRPPGRDLRLPNLHLRDLHWRDVAALAKGEGREVRSGVILPTMLTLAGAGATLFWWRQWAQGRAESEATAVAPAEGAPVMDTPAVATPVEIVDTRALDADLAVLGTTDEPPPTAPLRKQA